MSDIKWLLPFDQTATAQSNKIENEIHHLGTGQFRLIVPRFCAYYKSTLVVNHVVSSTEKIPLTSEQFQCMELLAGVSHLTDMEAYACFVITDKNIKGDIEISYQAVGGNEYVDQRELVKLTEEVKKLNKADWLTIDHPVTFTPKPHHTHILDHLYYFTPISRALGRITEIIGLQDWAIEKKILQSQLGKNIHTLYEQAGSDAALSLDAIKTSSDTSKQTRVVTNGLYIENEDDLKLLIDKNKTLRLMSLVQKIKYGCRAYSIALQELCMQQKNIKDEIMQVPMYMQNLSLWADFTDESKLLIGTKVKFTEKSKSRVFESDFNVFGKSSINGIHCAKMIFGSVLKKISGDDIRVGPESSFILVYGGRNAAVTALSNQNTKLRIDYSERSAVKILREEKNIYNIPLENTTNDDLHIFILSWNEFNEFSFSQSTNPDSNYTGMFGLSEPTPRQNFLFNTIGDAALGQSCDLFEIMVIDKSISEYEVDALDVYFQTKYSRRTNLIARGNFNDGFCDFETDYILSDKAKNKGEVSCIRKLFNGITTIGNYDVTAFLQGINKENLYGVIYAVNASDDITKVFWRKKINLSPGKMYRLRMNLAYNGTKPMIKLLINSQSQQPSKTPTNDNYQQDFEFVFTPTQENTTLELVNVNSTASTVQFSMDSIRLFRDYSARI